MYLDIPFQLGCRGLQGVRVLGDQNEVAPIGRGLAGKLKSYPAIAAGNEGEGGGRLFGCTAHDELLALLSPVFNWV